MKYLNNVTLSVFAKTHEDDVDGLKQALIEMVPLNLEDEKLQLEQKTAKGFNEHSIKIFTIGLTKTSHTNTFLKWLLKKLTEEQKDQMIAQRESRLDKDLHFFIRFDKEKWLNERELKITDSGDCFHLNLGLAVFPARRPDALVLVEKIFKPE